jgi:hypothetical protein
MADYYPVIARVVSSLDSNTAEVRQALYVRARTALTTELQRDDPPLSEPEVARERSALEAAIRNVEEEWPLSPDEPQKPKAEAEISPRSPSNAAAIRRVPVTGPTTTKERKQAAPGPTIPHKLSGILLGVLILAVCFTVGVIVIGLFEAVIGKEAAFIVLVCLCIFVWVV